VRILLTVAGFLLLVYAFYDVLHTTLVLRVAVLLPPVSLTSPGGAFYGCASSAALTMRSV
jgi:hypothetical protein